jgi:hypothetical protein
MADRNFTNTEGKYVYLTQQKKFFVSPDLHFAFASVGNSVDTEHPLFLSLLTAIKTNLEIAEFSKSDIFEIELNKAFKNMTIIVMTRRNVYILDVEENDNCENPKSVMYRKHLDNLLSYGTGSKTLSLKRPKPSLLTTRISMKNKRRQKLPLRKER